MFSKFKNKKTEYNGVKFDSKLELNIYKEIIERGLQVELQPKFELQEKFRLNGKSYRPIQYVGDFKLIVNDVEYIIDAKGMETQVFKIKAKMFAKIYKKEIIKIKSLKQFKEWLKEIGGIE